MKATAREMCAPLQHQIVTKGVARVEKGVKVYALSDYGYGTHAGCLGTNCGHMMTPFVIGVNDKPDLPDYLKDLTPEQAIENANKQAKQRMLERRIRDNKEKLHVARELGDKALIDTLKLKGKTLDMAMNSFLKDNEFLHRQKKREQLWRNEASIKATTNKLRETTRKIEEQYKKYRDIIGENNMPSMDKFKEMKYNNIEEFRELKERVHWKQARFPSERSFNGHFEKHQQEFGNITKEEYLEKALKLLGSQFKDNLLGYQTKLGRRVVYDINENIIVIGQKNKSGKPQIHTMLKPKEGDKYYYENYERDN